ncbi:MAG: TaqI family restriction endonuclease [Chloroherpetonaceae bacterium]
MNINELERFLETLTLSEKHRAFKGFEVDLKGDLNPTRLLNEIFWAKKEWLNIEEFFERYVRQCYPSLKRAFPEEVAQLGVKFGSHLAARLYRTQIGFLTEYHCAMLCEEVFLPDGFLVRRSPDLDRLGVDVQLVRASECYNLHIFVDSPRAWKFRREKRLEKSSNQEQGTHIDFPYQVRSGCIHSLRLLSNGFGVYRREYVEHLKSKILSGECLGIQAESVDCKRGLIFKRNIQEGTRINDK